MGFELISKKTRIEFRECLVGWTLNEIEREFDAAGLRPNRQYAPSCNGASRSLVEQYYHTIDFTCWSDVRRLLQVYEAVLEHLEQQIRDSTESIRRAAVHTLRKLLKCLRRDGYTCVDGRISRELANTDIAMRACAVTQLEAPELQRQLERMRQAIDDDPPLAIGAAKEMVETICKTILRERGVIFDELPEGPALLKLVRVELKLLPEGVPKAARGLMLSRHC